MTEENLTVKRPGGGISPMKWEYIIGTRAIRTFEADEQIILMKVMNKRKICVITGSRAEYGLLSGLMQAIKVDATLELQVIATNMHLSPEFGLTYKEIEKDGFHIDKKWKCSFLQIQPMQRLNL